MLSGVKNLLLLTSWEVDDCSSGVCRQCARNSSLQKLLYNKDFEVTNALLWNQILLSLFLSLNWIEWSSLLWYDEFPWGKHFGDRFATVLWAHFQDQFIKSIEIHHNHKQRHKSTTTTEYRLFNSQQFQQSETTIIGMHFLLIINACILVSRSFVYCIFFVIILWLMTFVLIYCRTTNIQERYLLGLIQARWCSFARNRGFRR